MAYIKEIFLSAEKSPFFHVSEGYYPDPAIQEVYQSSIENHLDRLTVKEEKNMEFFLSSITFVAIVIIVVIVIILFF